jgi:monoterpene epsilon-lactone hydrolase
MGDSAGGGMTVAVALQLRDRGLAAPYRTVLISPWLDISVAAPDISALAAKDHELAPPGLVAAGELYRGEVPAEDPRVSPINGGPFGLGPITLFSGTHDILHSDAKRFVPLGREAGVSIDYHEVPGTLHVYPLFPIPEAKRPRRLRRLREREASS